MKELEAYIGKLVVRNAELKSQIAALNMGLDNAFEQIRNLKTQLNEQSKDASKKHGINELPLHEGKTIEARRFEPFEPKAATSTNPDFPSGVWFSFYDDKTGRYTPYGPTKKDTQKICGTCESDKCRCS